MAAKDSYESRQTLNRNEIKIEQKEVQELENQRDQLMSKLKELDQEKRISQYKLREVGRILKHNQLKPLSPVKHGADSKGSKRSMSSYKNKLGHRGSTTNLMSAKNADLASAVSNKNTKGLTKNINTQSSQILIKKRKMYVKQQQNDSDDDMEKNQIIDYEKFKKQQDKKESSKLGKLKTKGKKGTFETTTMLK